MCPKQEVADLHRRLFHLRAALTLMLCQRLCLSSACAQTLAALLQVNQKPCTGGWCLTPRQSCPSSMATSPGHAMEAASAAVPIWLPALQKAEHLPGAWGLWRSTPAVSKSGDCQSGIRYEGGILLLACTFVEAKVLFPLHQSKDNVLWSVSEAESLGALVTILIKGSLMYVRRR